jgi:hypothetical protein
MWLYINLVYNFITIPAVDTLLLLPKLNNFLIFKIYNVFTFEFTSICMSMDFFGLILLMLAYLVGFISILSLDTRLF